MALNVVRYNDAGTPRWGVIRGEGVATLNVDATSTASLMSDEGLAAARLAAAQSDVDHALQDLELLCPVTSDRQLIAQGLNYSSHLREIGISSGKLPFNTLFRKASSCMAPADTPVIRPAHVRLLDYEVEIGIVMRRAITGPVTVTVENLAEYVGALVLHNDVSARDVQLPQTQFYKGKSYRTFGPTGPWLTLVDADDLRHFNSIEVLLEVNDEPRQRALAADISYKPAETLTELSQIQDVGPGDLIVTGTPGGTAVKSPGALKMFIARLLPDAKRWAMFIDGALQDPDYLRDGDVMRATAKTPDGAIDLGEQRNLIVPEGGL
ncbi:fumarylacetoacetate hydrolase [gamma proteobacterium NOR5-3]|nr:fumarylacetoacetate hydrolase [gamma proteobacterium NOR5-3]